MGAQAADKQCLKPALTRPYYAEDAALTLMAAARQRLQSAKCGKLKRSKLERHISRATGTDIAKVTKRLQKRLDAGKLVEVDGAVMLPVK